MTHVALLASPEAATLAEGLFERLQHDIVEGRIPPGGKISEPELARLHGVSRSSVREAIAKLEACKLVERRPNFGARVVTLSSHQLLELFHVREALEGMAARLAAEQMTEAEITDLRALLEHHSESIAQESDHAYFQQEGDPDFHYRIVQGSHNSYLIRLLCNDLYYLMRLYRFQFGMRSKRSVQALEEHRTLLEAIVARDGEMAELMMRQHIRSSRRNVEQQLQESQSA